MKNQEINYYITFFSIFKKWEELGSNIFTTFNYCSSCNLKQKASFILIRRKTHYFAVISNFQTLGHCENVYEERL